jgi:hypothetical protein
MALSPFSIARLLLLLTLLAGCSDQALYFGDDPRLLWWTDHETGDLSDWLGKSPRGGFVIPGSSRVEVTSGIARSGTYALRISYDKQLCSAPPCDPTLRDYPLAARSGPLPIGIYTSAWYYLPEAVHPASYWWFVLYRSRHSPFGSQDFRDEIRLSFTNRTDGSMGCTLLTEELGEIAPLVEREIPVRRWFHIETYLDASDGADGQFKAWQDGELTFQATGKMTQTTWMEWMTGAVIDGLTTSANQLYIDDAAMSEQRLGPLPPFERD